MSHEDLVAFTEVFDNLNVAEHMYMLGKLAAECKEATKRGHNDLIKHSTCETCRKIEERDKIMQTILNAAAAAYITSSSN